MLNLLPFIVHGGSEGALASFQVSGVREQELFVNELKAVEHSMQESGNFLSVLLENMNSAVLVVDEHFRIHQFNNMFLSLFRGSKDFDQQESFGQATGCTSAVLEEKMCGQADSCSACIFRKDISEAVSQGVGIHKKIVKREVVIGGAPVLKYLEMTIRPLHYEGQNMILVIIYDVTELVEKKRELRKKQETIDKDLTAAAEIQKSLLPPEGVHIEGLDISWLYRPSSLVGGDLFGVHHLGNDNYGLFILDVCGHGVAAGLVATGVGQFLLTRFGDIFGEKKEACPTAVMEELDKEFPFSRFNRFFTIVYAVINVRSGKLVYSCAGHPTPYVLRNFSDSPDSIAVQGLHVRGPLLGLGIGLPYAKEELSLAPGDTLVLYSDGLTELEATSGLHYGPDRFKRFLKKQKGRSVKDMSGALGDEFYDYEPLNHQQRDDISFLALRFEGL
jgi:sigma-B regulation protein RsbU (phosphoserine phosphatase)